jgi:hypothetical protein
MQNIYHGDGDDLGYMSPKVIRHPCITKVQVRSQASPRAVCDGQSGTGRDFYSCNSTNAPYTLRHESPTFHELSKW